MTEPILRYNAGAVCLMIALFSVGVMQLIYCWEHVELFNQLDDEQLDVISVEGSLETFDIELGGIRLSTLVQLRSKVGKDCRLDELAKDFALIDHYYDPNKKKNAGLYKFTKHYFDERARLCFQKIVNNIGDDVTDLSETQLKDAKELQEKFDANKFDLFYLTPSEMGALGAHMTEVLKKSMQRWTPEKKSAFKSSCVQIDAIMKQHIPQNIWYKYREWLEYQKSVEFGSIKTGAVCAAYLALYPEKPGKIVVYNEVAQDRDTNTYLGYGLAWQPDAE